MSKKTAKQTLSMALAASMVIAPVQAFAASSDIAGHWAEQVITEWQNKGLITGYEDGTFKPGNSVTRAEFVTIMNNAMGFNKAGDVTFSDVQANNWFYKAVATAVATGYCKGYNDGTFKPNATISRAEAAVMIANATGLAQDESGAAQFSDDIPSWAKGSVGAVVKAGYMSGYKDGTFGAYQSITRAETVSSLNRAIGNGAKNDVVVTEDDTVVDSQTITGNLIIDEAVGSGEVYVKNSTVKGDLIIRGGGDDSIYLDNVTIEGKIIVEKKNVRVQMEGKTTASNVVVNEICTLTSANFDGSVGTITIAKELGIDNAVVIKVPVDKVEVGLKSSVDIYKDVNTVTISKDAEESKVYIANNVKVGTVITNCKASITGSGKIEKLEVNANGVTVGGSLTVDKTEVASGVDKPSTGGSSSGGGGGSSRPPVALKDTVVVRPDGSAPGVSNYEYSKKYAQAGVEITNGTTRNNNTLTLTVDASKLTETKVEKGLVAPTTPQQATVGVQFETPEGAKYAKVSRNDGIDNAVFDGTAQTVDLTKDGPQAYQGKLLFYVPIAQVTTSDLNTATDKVDSVDYVLPDGTYNIKVEWYDADPSGSAKKLSTSTFKVNRKVTNNTTVDFRPQGEAVGAASFDYPTLYKEAGVTIDPATSDNSNTATYYVDTTGKHEKVLNGFVNGTHAYVGLQFDTPTNAVSYDISINGKPKRNHELGADGPAAYKKKAMQYFGFAEVTPGSDVASNANQPVQEVKAELDDATFNIVIDFKDASGKTIFGEQKYTVKRVKGSKPPVEQKDGVIVRPDGSANGVEDYKYSEKYEQAGIQIKNGTDKNNNTLTMTVDASQLTAGNVEKGIVTPTEVKQASVGVQFKTPVGAKYAKVSRNDGIENGNIFDGTAKTVDLTKDGPQAYKGSLLFYVPVAQVTASDLDTATNKVDSVDYILPDGAYDIQVEWYDGDPEKGGKVISGTNTFKVERKVINNNTVGFRPDGPAGNAEPDFKYADNYEAAGVTIDVNGNKATYSVNTTDKQAQVLNGFVNGTHAYVGLQFATPKNAVSYDITINDGAKTSHQLDEDGPAAFKNTVVRYFGFAEVEVDPDFANNPNNAVTKVVKDLDDKTYTITIDFKDADGNSIVGEQTYTVDRVKTSTALEASLIEEVEVEEEVKTEETEDVVTEDVVTEETEETEETEVTEPVQMLPVFPDSELPAVDDGEVMETEDLLVTLL